MSSIVSFKENTQNTPLYNGVNYNINVLKEYYNNNKQQEVEEEPFYSDITTSESEEEEYTLDIKDLDLNKLTIKGDSEYFGDYKYYYDGVEVKDKPLFTINNKINVYAPSKRDTTGLRLTNGLYVEEGEAKEFISYYGYYGKYKNIFLHIDNLLW